MGEYNCPECCNPLEPVVYPANSPLNFDQWSAIRAGDYVCNTCPGDRGKSGKRYFWKSELEDKLAEQVPLIEPNSLHT